MSFPAMNAQSVTKRFVGGSNPAAAVCTAGQLPSGPHNLLSVPGVVDVSGMEFSLGIAADSISGQGTLAAGSTSAISITLSDGGATGDNTTVAVLATAITSTVAWADTTPKDVAGSSATDLDADDWINLHLTAVTTTTEGAGQVDVALAYIYGKPGAIN